MATTKIIYRCQHGEPCPACEAAFAEVRFRAKHPVWWRYRPVVRFSVFFAMGVFVLSCTDFHWPSGLEVLGSIISTTIGFTMAFLALIGTGVLVRIFWKKGE
jgi:hypothetical protein